MQSSTNVLVSGRISPRGIPARLLEDAEEKSFELVVSEQLLEEVRDVISCQKMRRYFPSSEVPVYLNRLRAIARVAEGAPSGAGSTSDRDDDYLVGLVGFIAMSQPAECRLVSGDRHLLDLPDRTVKDAEGGILAHVLTPREFLEELERAE